MVKIENGKAVREPVPDFLDRSGTPEAIAALADLSWTDPSLGVQKLAWWPEENGDGELGANKKWGAEVLTLDAERQVVLVTRKQVAMTAAEKAAQADAMRPGLTAANNAQYDAAISSMTSDYPAAEISTWERQRAEVIAWASDSTAPAPWIDIAASARGLDRGEYLARTLGKVNAFASASAYLTGRRQGIDDQIRAATTAEELAGIVINYTLPGA